jgi:hypothetical protein
LAPAECFNRNASKPGQSAAKLCISGERTPAIADRAAPPWGRTARKNRANYPPKIETGHLQFSLAGSFTNPA